MNFDALKEKLRDQFTELWGRVQELSIYMSALERYEALNSRVQKAILIGSLVAAVLFLLSFPYANLTSSGDNLAKFDENRELIRRLLKAAKTLKEPSPLPPEMSSEMLSGEITRALDEFHLVSEQNGGVKPSTEKGTTLVPEAVKQVPVSLTLKKLNLKQIVEISHRLQSLNAGVKLMGLDVRENAASSHYFDVVFKLVDFSVPRAALPVDTGKNEKGGKGRAAPKVLPAKEDGVDAPPPPPEKDE